MQKLQQFSVKATARSLARSSTSTSTPSCRSATASTRSAAHLLYFIIKDHPFIDGNKRIGSLLFLDYLRRNGALLRPDGTPRFADNALVALALLVAESDPSHKPLVIRVILNLLGDDGG